ncbi:MAG: peptide chain release factor 1 [Clostridia bacterium]|nr:peptide chain release factor 1 [Clostridia bacterium]
MSQKLTRALDRYKEIETILASQGASADPETYASLMKEYRALSEIYDKSEEYSRAEKEIEDLTALLASEDDLALKELCEGELRDAKERQERVQKELNSLLIPHDPDDDRNVILEIRAGAGGEEAALFVADLFRMYSMYAERNGFRVELLSENRTELGGFRQLSALLSGNGAFARFRYESGVHRVQRVPVTEAQGRIQTSTVTVAVLPEVGEVEVNLSPEDVKMETCKSSGAGGQHINKTESAVRLTHLPTGIVVECQEERSQYKNRDKAMKLLASKLYEIKRKERDDAVATERKQQVGTGDRSEKIRTYNFPQGRVTDHRIGYTVYTLDAFLNGEIGAMIDALRLRAAEEKLAGNDQQV